MRAPLRGNAAALRGPKVFGSAISHDRSTTSTSVARASRYWLTFRPRVSCLRALSRKRPTTCSRTLLALNDRVVACNRHSPDLFLHQPIGIKSKCNRTDATFLQYPHQTASGRREIRAAADQGSNNNPSGPRPQERRSPASGSTKQPLDDYCLTSPPGSPHKSAVQDIKHKHQPSQSSTSSRPLSPANASAPQYHASSSPPRRSNSSATADVDTGKIPRTWTRNSIRIPVRTRYAILIPGTPR